MRTRVLTLVALAGVLVSCAYIGQTDSGLPATLTKTDDRVRVEIGGQLFTEYHFKDGPKPYLYPVLAADGTELMRHFPMKRDVEGEVTDHPHHRSLWFTHGAVNGVDFWTEGENRGKIVNEAVEHAVQNGVGVIRARNKWVAPSGEVFLTDETTIRARGTPEARFLDYEVTLKAPADKPVVLGDTKEGSMAIRVPLWMTPDHAQGKGKRHTGQGTIVNDSGVKNADAWGKKSKWVDYYAPKDGKIYGIAMFDHPSNPRHPTWWHVRDYGLFAANPFGQHDFEPEHRSNLKAGDMTIPPGGSVTFKWRFYFHTGDEKTARVAQHYADYAGGK